MQIINQKNPESNNLKIKQQQQEACWCLPIEEKEAQAFVPHRYPTQPTAAQECPVCGC